MTNLALSTFPSTNQLAQHRSRVPFPGAAPWRGILAVEPDSAALHAGTLLLTKANYCVTPASSDRELFLLRGTKAVGLAMLSDHLGERLLRIVARTVRRQWPRTRILILGQVAPVVEDYLYDERISRSSDPEQVLADLERLYAGMWNQGSNTLDWNPVMPALGMARQPVVESDPTKTVPQAPMEDPSLRDRPADIRLPSSRRN